MILRLPPNYLGWSYMPERERESEQEEGEEEGEEEEKQGEEEI
jgi:hypothetical protein